MKSKTLILISMLLMGIALISYNVSQQGTADRKPVVVGLYAPDIEVIDAKSSAKLSSQELKGKVLLINFWASWCKSCIEEMPSIEALYKEMQNNKNFLIMPVIFKDSVKNASNYLNSNGYTLPMYSDSGEISSKNYGVRAVPETYLIDKKGVLRHQAKGPTDWNSPELKNLIISLLNE